MCRNTRYGKKYIRRGSGRHIFPCGLPVFGGGESRDVLEGGRESRAAPESDIEAYGLDCQRGIADRVVKIPAGLAHTPFGGQGLEAFAVMGVYRT